MKLSQHTSIFISPVAQQPSRWFSKGPQTGGLLPTVSGGNSKALQTCSPFGPSPLFWVTWEVLRGSSSQKILPSFFPSFFPLSAFLRPFLDFLLLIFHSPNLPQTNSYSQWVSPISSLTLVFLVCSSNSPFSLVAWLTMPLSCQQLPGLQDLHCRVRKDKLLPIFSPFTMMKTNWSVFMRRLKTPLLD